MSPVTRTGAPSRPRILAPAIIAAVATVLAILPTQSAQATTTAATYSQMMQHVVDETNAIRASAGLRPLVRNADLDRVAAAWSLQQWQNGTMSHNPNFSTQIPSGWQRAGENVARGYTYLQVVPAWKASPGHYANIVNDYTSIGIGYFEQDGRRYWTQLFAKYPGVTQPDLTWSPTMLSEITAPTHATAPSPRDTEPTTSSPTSGSAAGPAAPVAPAPPTAPADPPTDVIALSPAPTERAPVAPAAAPGSVDQPAPVAPSGVRELLMSGSLGRTLTRPVTTQVDAGSTHVSTVWVRTDAAAAGTVRLLTLGGASTESTRVPFVASSSGWVEVSVALTATSAHAGFRLEILTPGHGHTTRLDAVPVVRT